MYCIIHTINYPPFSLANGSRAYVLVGVTKKEGNITSRMSSSSFSSLMLNWYETGSSLFSVCECVCAGNMIYTEENIISDYNEERR